MIYATPEALARYFPTDTKSEEMAIVTDDLEAASRFVDAETGRPDNYFAPAVPDIEAAPAIIANPTANPPIVGVPAIEFVDKSFVKTFFGNGRSILPLPAFADANLANVPEVIANPTAQPPVVGVPAQYAVTTIEGETVPPFILVREANKQYLQTVDNYGRPSEAVWNYDQPFYIRAHWGYAETPAAIKKAVIQIVLGWRQRERGILGQVNPEGFIRETDIPLSAKSLIAPFKVDPLDDVRVRPLTVAAMTVENCDSIFVSHNHYYSPRLY